jgi:hypothetical protein
MSAMLSASSMVTGALSIAAQAAACFHNVRRIG